MLTAATLRVIQVIKIRHRATQTQSSRRGLRFAFTASHSTRSKKLGCEKQEMRSRPEVPINNSATEGSHPLCRCRRVCVYVAIESRLVAPPPSQCEGSRPQKGGEDNR